MTFGRDAGCLVDTLGRVLDVRDVDAPVCDGRSRNAIGSRSELGGVCVRVLGRVVLRATWPDWLVFVNELEAEPLYAVLLG